MTSKQTKALEALRDYRRSDDDRVSVAMGLLQEALAEQPAQQDQDQDQGQSCYCPNCEALSKELAALKAQQQEIDELTAQRDNLADILTRTANALKGQPEELSLHSWHDLPEVAQQLKAAQHQEPVEWNKKIRDSVDSLLAQAGFDHDSSVRHQLACMNFDTPQQHRAEKNWRHVIPGRRKTDEWDSARVADYNQGWNDCQKKTKGELEKLYTSPPAQPSKPWVGLTQEEIQPLLSQNRFAVFALARAIEAKLKDKNGY